MTVPILFNRIDEVPVEENSIEPECAIMPNDPILNYLAEMNVESLLRR